MEITIFLPLQALQCLFSFSKKLNFIPCTGFVSHLALFETRIPNMVKINPITISISDIVHDHIF